ncbi:MAG: tetratricopeptide repeat protein [Bryobacteraceae bacterium]
MTFPARVALGVLTAAALAQNGDIFQRVRRALSPYGQDELASEALTKKDYRQVEEILTASKPSNQAARAELLSLLGAVQFLDRKFEAAASSYREAAKLAPLEDSDNFTLAMALVDLGDDAHARDVLAGLAARYPDRPIYLYWLGRIDYDQRRYEEAIAKLTKVTELAPQSVRAWDSLGLAFDMQGRTDQARSAFEKAVSLNRNQANPSPWPPHNLGYLLLRTNEPTEAETVLRESIRYDPKLAQTHYYLGRVLEKQDSATEAIHEYLNAISLDTASPDACYSLARLYRKLHREPEAAAMFSEYKKRKQAVATLDLESPASAME